MKKILVLLMVAVLAVGGCATINSFLCTPTSAQVEAAQVGLALAQAALTAAAVFTGGSVLVAALSSQAIPVFQKVIAGYCSVNADWQNAVSVVAQAQTATKGKAIDPAIAMLQAVQWSR